MANWQNFQFKHLFQRSWVFFFLLMTLPLDFHFTSFWGPPPPRQAALLWANREQNVCVKASISSLLPLPHKKSFVILKVFCFFFKNKTSTSPSFGLWTWALSVSFYRWVTPLFLSANENEFMWGLLCHSSSAPQEELSRKFCANCKLTSSLAHNKMLRHLGCCWHRWRRRKETAGWFLTFFSRQPASLCRWGTSRLLVASPAGLGRKIPGLHL